MRLKFAFIFTISLIIFVCITQNPVRRLFSNEQDPLTPERLTGTYDASETEAYFHKQKFYVPSENDTPEITEISEIEDNVLGKKKGEKRIEVNLTKQKLYAYEGKKKKYEFLISSGKWGLTPTGEFKIWTKLRYTLMTGGSQAWGTYYYLPDVPYVMYFNGGYGIHGTYWHSNFGHPMSHGCINMNTEEAGKIFNWADVGTPVIIYGTAPNI